MKIANVISSIDTSTGGPARSVTHLVEGLLHKSDMNVSLHCKTSSDPILKDFKKENGSIHCYPSNWLGRLNGLEEEISKQKPDLLHGHGLWQMPVHQMAKIARKHDIPYIITPRGMLEPWALKQGKWKKKTALALYQRNDLKQADVLHATAEMEKEQLRKLGFTNSVVVIPNGIQIEQFKTTSNASKNVKNKALFLSRIHPKKGIEMLIEAWSQLHTEAIENWVLEIVGNGEPGYVKQLQQKIDGAKLEQEIKIVGPLFGDDKLNIYADADLFVLPTYSENFGIVVAEALASETPVITTKGAPWQDLETHGAGWWIEIGTEPLKQVLEEALSLPADKRGEMGKKGRVLVEEKYSIEAVAEQMYELYKWIKKEKGDTSGFLHY